MTQSRWDPCTSPPEGTYRFELVPGFFVPTEWERDITNRFGLAHRFDTWAAFAAAVDELKHAAEAAGDVVKVLYTARHGEAEHNVLAEKYNEPDDDGVRSPLCLARSHPQVQLKYPITDPNLTPVGVAQARRLGAIFEAEAARGMPLPSRFFVSPLRRPGETCGLEWGWRFRKAPVEGDMGHGVPGEVVEQLREHLHVHECDKRLPRHELARLFPSFTYPPDMPDEDSVWQSGAQRGRETEDEMVLRAGEGLAIVFDACGGDDTYVSITAHSGVLRAVYKNLRVPLRRLVTGEMNVLVIRARRL
ncbi:putative phosphoglycerate mutase PMU1 [Vanrija pseudolonga]|uniref:Phosphoglycerate mutase PMU1 n=1 Tax=Vanrija pseudolonga TaxID=143232 RepID=A0AAF0YGY9_9TREE|nr:putative phosphoglycerate mutase PMU1 [Vanrija pseudolonga]